MIYRDIYRAIEEDGKFIMTNRVEALFMPSIRLVEVNMSDRKRDPLLYSKLYCQHCLLLLLALFCYWHHCDIGITGAQSCALCRMHRTGTKKGKFIGSMVPLSDVFILLSACCIVIDR